jgi:DNA-binding MarR family transcriptional regulator
MNTRRTLANLRANWPAVVTPQTACIIAIQRAAALLQANARMALSPFGLSFTEFEILAALRSSPPPHELIPTALYDALLISSGGLTKVLKALENRGLIARPARPGDRRRRPIALTAAGRNLAETAMAAMQAKDARALPPTQLSDKDSARLAALLDQVLDGLEGDGVSAC